MNRNDENNRYIENKLIVSRLQFHIVVSNLSPYPIEIDVPDIS